jgi:hypothetical protein
MGYSSERIVLIIFVHIVSHSHFNLASTGAPAVAAIVALQTGKIAYVNKRNCAGVVTIGALAAVAAHIAGRTMAQIMLDFVLAVRYVCFNSFVEQAISGK